MKAVDSRDRESSTQRAASAHRDNARVPGQTLDGSGSRGSTTGLVALQRLVGNQAVAATLCPVQRVGGWADADTHAGTGLDPKDHQSGWNTEEHAVGAIRRIPLDGLEGGLQSSGESKEAHSLSDESVAGPVHGPARPHAAGEKEKVGRGRAIALLPAAFDASDEVTVFFHLHGNTENASRGFGGWRQHAKNHKVRDVARDRIGQQLEATGSHRVMAILPQGVMQSKFGAIAPDAYIRDAFARLTELGAWAKPPPSFQVVLSAHSGGGFTVGRMIDGSKGYELPANLKTLVLFEALHTREKTDHPEKNFNQVTQFATWIKGRLAKLVATLNDPHLPREAKQAALDHATQIRLVWDPVKSSYNAKYEDLRTLISRWFAENRAALGPNEKAVKDLVVFAPINGVGHEGLLQSGLTDALNASLGNAHAALPATAPTAPPTPTSSATSHRAARESPSRRRRSAPAPSTAHADTADPLPTTDDDDHYDPATVRPARAARGVPALTDEEKQDALDTAIRQVTTKGTRQDRTDVANTLRFNGVETDEDWWGGMVFDASFLDVPIRPSGGEVPGVHRELHERLQVAETSLMRRFPDLTKAQIAGHMGIHQIAGVRIPKKATGATLPSFHSFGLAVDINHPTNPFVGNMSPTLEARDKRHPTDEEKAALAQKMANRSPRIIERAMLLLKHEHFNVEKSIDVPRGRGSETGRLWEIHHRASNTLAEYLRLADEPDTTKLEGLVDGLRATGDTRTVAEWQAQIRNDKQQIRVWDFMHHDAPERGGYMDLHKALVEALVDDGHLLWGGSYSGHKDIMHFDFRHGTISRRPPAGWTPPPRTE